MTDVSMPPEVVPLKAESLGNTTRHRDYSNRDPDSKTEVYRKACGEADRLAAARGKCRNQIDAVLKASPEEAALLGRAMIEVGAAACRDLGDAHGAAFLLGHLSRRIREGNYIDF